MSRAIKKTIYRVQYTATWFEFVECENTTDLFEFIANKMANENTIVSGANEMQLNGKTPRIAFLTNPEFRKILKHYKSEKINN